MSIVSDFVKVYNGRIIKRAVHQSNGIKSVHRIDYRNAGDLYCAPYHYYDQLNIEDAVDIFPFKKFKGEKRKSFINNIINNDLIIGGGGLLNTKTFQAQMQLFEYLERKGKKIVFWGVGHNSGAHQSNANLTYNINPNGLKFFSTRDISKPGEYVPCVSCKHPQLDIVSDIKHEIGLVLHKKTINDPYINSHFTSLPSCDNTQNIETIIDFIKSCEHVITNSYHVMYWSMLLQRKVAVIPKVSKFFDFEHQPVFTTYENAIKDVKKGETFSGLLEKCRAINDDFASRAFNYLNI